MENFDLVEERVHPVGATCVADLISAARGSEKITYRRTSPPTRETRYYAVQQMGEYFNECVPRFVNRPAIDLCPRPARGAIGYRSLASLGEIQLEFKIYGGRRMAPFYSGWGINLFLLSDALLDVVQRRDPNAFETATPKIAFEDGVPVRGYTVVMPTRVIDAADIEKTDISIARYVRPPHVGPTVTLAQYESGLVLRGDIDVATFRDLVGPDWFWSVDLIKEVAAAGVRGVRFSHPTSFSWPEIRLPGEGDIQLPDDW
jgi:hypothetical protein